jgi:hypothetical protein
MNRETLEYLIKKEIFSLDKFGKEGQIVDEYEIGMSQRILENGWNIGSKMKYYEGVDFTFKTKQPEEYGIQWLNDIMYPNGFFGLYTIDPYEVMFIKGNRFYPY